MKVFSKWSPAAIGVICLLMSGIAPAEEVSGERETAELEGITVTAQKREENVQKVPVTITVFDEIALADRDIETVQDIAAYTPNFMMFGFGRSDAVSPSLRGIFANISTQSVATGVYVDGVPVFDGWSMNDTLNDVERVEVLKGPQGTLYGKNTEAGVINIITKQPGNTFGAKMGVEVGSDNKRQYKINVSGPLVKDRFYAAFSGNHYEKDGFMDDTKTGETLDDRKRDSGKLTLRWTPSERLDISFINSHTAQDDGGVRWGLITQTKDDATIDFPSFNESTVTNSALKVTYHLKGSGVIESVTTRRRFNNDASQDFDFTDNPMFANHVEFDHDTTSYSQELRYNQSLLNDRLNLLMGVYADTQEENENTHSEMFNPHAGSLMVWTDKKEFNDDSVGIFAHAKYQLGNSLRLLGGARYDRDEKEYTFNAQNINESETFSEISPKAGVEYEINPDMMAFATVSKGYRAGGYNQLGVDGGDPNISYDEEKLWSYELGFKSLLLNRKLLFNACVYYMDVDDMQVMEAVNARAEIVTNAGKAHSAGFEIETRYQATHSLEIFASFGYNKTEFDEFTDTVYDQMGNTVGSVSYEGKTNPFAPAYNYNIGAQYRSASGCYARVDVNGYGKMYLDKANQYERDAYGLVNVKLGYEMENIDIYLYSKNLFDEDYDAKGYYGYYNLYAEPREIGVQLTWRF